MRLYFTIAAWAFLTGILEIVAAVHLRKHISNEIWLIVGGIASILFGVLMLWFPLAGMLAVIWIIAAYAIVFGFTMIGFALRLRSHAQTPAQPDVSDDAGTIVVGGGHAGVEAALASARLGVPTLLVTGDPAKICTLPCNPSIGGSAKGQLVREIDALGGAMGVIADECSLHARFLNESKGPAVRALRQQMDKPSYARTAIALLRAQPNLTIVRDLSTISSWKAARFAGSAAPRHPALRQKGGPCDRNLSWREVLPGRRGPGRRALW